MTDKVYNHTEYTEITQYNVEDADTFMGGKKYIPVFHGLQKRPSSEQHPNPIELHEWYVEIGWPTDTPWDVEMYDDEILASSWKERPVHPDAIFVSPTSWKVKLASPLETLQLSASVIPAWSEFPISWRSSDTSKATVSDKGLVTPVAVWESITITATSWAVSATATIDVEKVWVTQVSFDKETLNMLTWETFTLTAEITPSNAYIKNVTWSTSDDTIATVEAWANINQWTITALAEWEVTITATSVDDNTKTATCVITITDETPVNPGE